VVGGTKGDKLNNVNKRGMTEAFVMKYNSSGKRQWTKLLGTWRKDFANAVAIDSSGNIYVAGVTERDLEDEPRKDFAGKDDLFVVKYDSKGKKHWTKQLGTKRNDRATGVATDSSGNIYVTGYTYWGLDGNTNAGSNDAFLVKYLDNGTKQWTKQFGTSSTDLADGVATDSSGNVYLVGYTYGGLDGNTNTGASDLFVVKYNSSGTKQWTKQLGTSSADSANGVATDSSGNVYVTGNTGGGLDFNTSAGDHDLLLSNPNCRCTKLLADQLGRSFLDNTSGVATDSSGNVYVTGYTQGGLDGNINAGNLDLFVVKYNSSGTKQWTKQLGSSSRDYDY